MVADANGGAIRAPDASNPGKKPSKNAEVLVEVPNKRQKNGIPDCSWRRCDDGALCVNHCAMLKRAGMAITFIAYLA